MTRYVVTPGLAPSPTLAPAATLAPAGPIYSAAPISPHAVAMALGTGGALIDVSVYVEFGEGITYTYGRSTQFDDVTPGTFTFTLNNSDGRFTPDNPYSPYPATVKEGLVVCWQLGSRLTRGTVLSVDIPPDEASWHHLVVTCDDMLGAAGRHLVKNLPDALLMRENVDLLWRLDDDSDATQSAEANNDGLGGFSIHSSNPNSTTQVAYGVQQADGLPGTAVTVTAPAGETVWFGTEYGNTTLVSSVTSPTLTPGVSYLAGFWNLWVYPGSTINFAVTPKFATGPSYSYSAQIQCTPATVSVKGGTGAVKTWNLTAAQQQNPNYYSMALKNVWQSSRNGWGLFLYLYVNGMFTVSTQWIDPMNGTVVPGTAGALSPVVVNVSVTTPSGATPLSGTVQRISHTPGGAGLEQNALYNTLDQRRAVLDFVAAEIDSAPYNGPLSSAPIGYPDVDNTSVLDIYNDIARTEAGHLFCQTTGSLTSPNETIQVRARDRPALPETSFDATVEGQDPPTFVRDITNVAAQLDVAGPTQTVTVTDPTVTGRYVTAGASETVLYTGVQDLREWGEDRLYRGRNRAIRTEQFTIDTLTTPTDRSADVLALVPGDRLRLTNLPLTRLGFTWWDGWLIGGSETHTVSGNRFQLTLTPVLPDPAFYDTGRYAADGDATLTGDIAATDTTIGIVTASGAGLSTETPYTVRIGQEQMTVTRVVGAGATTTVTRGVNGTTAVAHTAGTALEVVPTAVYSY